MPANRDPGVMRPEATVSWAHQWAWTSAVSVAGGIGVILTCYLVSAPAIVGTGLIGALVGCVVYPPFYRSGPPASAPDPWVMGRTAAIGAAVALAVTGPLSLMGPAALLLAVLLAVALAVTSPSAVRHIARWRLLAATEQATSEELANEHDAARSRLDATTDRLSPHELSTHQLCRAWRTSFVLLERTEEPGARALLSTLRRRCLDELERRDPVGFERWMAAGARAASDPSRYLDESHDERK